MEDKRLIEVDFPLKEVGEESVKEKSIRHGHISTLHIWWARRPLATSRATTYAALIPAPKDQKELREKLKFIAELSKWENSLNEKIIEKARKNIKEFFGGRAPKVLDCFAGGGSIPLEALRLGCETYALEYNPVAVLILKATLEYPQKYRKKLVEDIKKWGEWVYEEAKKEIGRFYPEEEASNQKTLTESGGEKYIPVGYIWARTIKCQDSSCRAEIPLIKQLWLVRKENRKMALKMIVDKQNKRIDFKIVKDKEIDFDPSKGTVKKATVQCPVCGRGIDDDYVRRQFREGKAGQKMIAVVLYNPKKEGKIYRLATEKDLEIFKEAEKYLEKKRYELLGKWVFDPVPNEPMNTKDPNTVAGRGYGFTKWGDLFNSRQKLALITFMEKVRNAYEKMLAEGYEEEYAKVVTSYLAIILDRLADKNSNLVVYNVVGEKIEHAFGRQALAMVWDYVEVDPFTDVGWPNAQEWVERVIDHVCQTATTPAEVAQFSAISLPYPDNYFDAVITDPPYYDNVNYAELSDFFYVWLKRVLGDLYPDLFATPLVPKSEEIVSNPVRHGGEEKAKQFFEKKITEAFKEIYRVLKQEGIACIVFAHKSTKAWETIINALLNSGLYLTASWPIHTEMRERLLAKGTAALASSVYMVCRKRTKEEVAYFNEIKEKIKERIREKLEQFWEQGISGADFFVSAIGPAVEVFGRYSRVEKLSGEKVSVEELLEYVREVVSEFALQRVLKNAYFGGIDGITRFYLLWRWTFGNAKVHFDDAIKLSRPMGVEIEELGKGGLVKKEKEFVKVLNPIDRAQDQDFLKRTRFTSMIDVLHYALILWEREEKERIKEVLNETGYGKNEIFWQVAQALSEILPEGDKEKQLLQGFLAGKKEYKGMSESRTLLEFMGEKS